MAFGGFTNQARQQPTAEINMIPLIDVMLVLLVIFIVTAPLLTHAVKVDLPQATSAPAPVDADTVELTIDAQGRTYWDSQAMTPADLPLRLAEAAQRKPQPQLRLRADGAVAYREVAQVMAAAVSAGLERIGFVTAPEEETP